MKANKYIKDDLMKGMVDSFIILLAIALGIIVVLSLISGAFTLPSGEFKAVEEFGLGIVGVSGEGASTIINIGELGVGKTQEDLVKQALELDVSQGAFGGQKHELLVTISPAFLEAKRGVKVTFSVLEANALGNMLVKWNGKTFYNAKPSGLTQLEIEPQYVKEENILTLEAEGPGLLFWSSTQYKVRNFKVFILYGPQKIVPFQLLPSELQAFDRGEVDFFSSGGGVLEVKVNGFSSFAGTPSGPSKAVFDVGFVKPGNNVLSFISSSSNILSGTVFRIFTTSPQIAKSRTFSLTQEQINQIKKGRVDFVLEETIKPGILQVKINQNSLVVQTQLEGTNTIFFSREDVLPGPNTIEFSGSGTWDISTVKVGYEV